MATFSAGQKVRYINTILNPLVPTGTEGVVLSRWNGYDGAGYYVNFPGCKNSVGTYEWGVYPHSIAPLTDPGADAFMERIKKLEREPRVEVIDEKRWREQSATVPPVAR